MAKDGRKNIQLWKLNPDMEKEFIDLCLESAALHGYAGSSLKVWSNIIMALNSKYNQHFDQKALKNKWTSLRGGYMQWRELTHKTGHGYNANNGTFNWPDEVWKAVIQKDNKLAKFKTRHLMYFKELEQLFEGTFATGFAHARLRNVIERAFSVLKCRFPILERMSSYSFRTQTHIVVACMALHNYLRRYSLDDALFQEFKDDDAEINNDVPMDFDDPMTPIQTFRPQDQAAMIEMHNQIADALVNIANAHV